MGIFFTLLYILTAYLSPDVLFGPLAAYHVEIVIALLATIISIPALLDSRLLRLPQTLAIAGMTFAVFASLVAGGWLGGAPAAVYDFSPNVFIYFLIVLHCKTRRHLQLIVVTLLAVCAFVTFNGWLALRANDATSLYLYDQGIGDGKAILRLRGLSFINDPNDFSQLLVSLLPLVFLFWKKESGLRNTAFVLFPLALLVFAMYLTHSRGAVIALLVVIILAGRRKIGTIWSVALAGIFFVLSSIAGWSGGREISVEAGSDRMEAWAVGLQLIRSHPFFGVGLFRFADYNQITAHNTVVVCAAELGFVGLFFWVLFVFTSIRYGVALTPAKAIAPAPQTAVESVPPSRPIYAAAQPPRSFDAPAYKVLAAAAGRSQTLPLASISHPPQRWAPLAGNRPARPADEETAEDTAATQQSETRRNAALMVIALGGYLAAGWFLSRAYVMTLFIYGGMMQVLLQIAVDKGFAPPILPLKRLLWMSAGISVALLAIVYMILRLKNHFPG